MSIGAAITTRPSHRLVLSVFRLVQEFVGRWDGISIFVCEGIRMSLRSGMFSFLQSIPSVFAKQWLPKKLVGVSLLDSAGQRSTARWAGNRKSSACLKGFKAFSLSHRLEEGDTLVFELMDANPDNLVFLIHVFRVVELSNNAFIPHEVDNDASHLLTDSEDDSDDSSLQSPTKTKSKQKTPAAYGENGGPPLVGKGFCADVLPLAVRMPEPEPFHPFPVAGKSPTHEGNQ